MGLMITPDTKDWTWVLRQPCGECGFDTSAFAREAVAGMLTANAAAWPAILCGPSLGAADAGTRPAPEQWSALEYGCHVRDAIRLYDYRLGLMLTEDDPLYPNWDQDATAVEGRYDQQVPAAVAGELVAAADELAARFRAVSGSQWERTGRRSDGAQFTVETFARYFIHDPVHHFYDVTGTTVV
jgi:hypothetical protein